MLRFRSFKVWLACALLLAFILALPVHAQTSITIDAISRTCSSAQLTYTVNAAAGAVLVTIFADSVQIGGGSGDSAAGTHTVIFEFVPQPNGTLITFNVGNDLGTTSAVANCISSSTPPVDDDAPPADAPETAPPDTGGAWNGDTDGRINPDRAEYYTIYCQNDIISVWRSNPRSEEIKQIRIKVIETLAIGGVVNLGSNMTLVRNSQDTVTIYGSNGNLAPQAGQKAFSIQACLAANESATVTP